jgi:Integrase zinc binding domain
MVETKILKEENEKLLLNQQARIAIMQVSCEDQRMEKFNGLIKVPKSMENQILKWYHDDIRVQRNVYIPGLTRKGKNYIKRCDECQRNKHDNSKPLGKMITKKDTLTLKLLPLFVFLISNR